MWHVLGRKEMRTVFSFGNLEEREYLTALSLNARTVLKGS